MKNAIFCSLSLLVSVAWYNSPAAWGPSYKPSKTTLTQDTTMYYLEVNGNVREMKNVMGKSGDNPWMDSAIVTIYCNNIVYANTFTTRRGKCSFKLPLNKKFTVELSKPKYVSKRFDVNTKVPSNKYDAFSFYFDMDIFERLEGVDVTILDKPIAMVAYNVTNNQFEYDMTYTNKINAELKSMYHNYYMFSKKQKETHKKNKN